MLQAHAITKSYGAVTALDRVDLSFRSGEIHAVLGENGAGKSTLMGVLSGFIKPDSGSVNLGESRIAMGNPARCRKLGIELIHQHFTLVPRFSVAENLGLPRLNRLSRLVDPEREARSALRIGRSLGWDFDPDQITGSLPVGSQQRLEILKALASDAGVLIFDEPTAVLTESEVSDLFLVFSRLKDDGKTVILIAHKLREVLRIADRITVLRHGRVIGSVLAAEASADSLALWMVGDLPAARTQVAAEAGTSCLSVESLQVMGDRGEQAVRGVSFNVKAGEVFGIGGVDGNGQVELAETLASVRSQSSGKVAWDGRPPNSKPVRLAYIPQDRQVDGLALDLSVEENLVVEALDTGLLSTGPFLRPASVRRWALDLIRRFEIRTQGPKQLVRYLSGGNQQKIVVSRALSQSPDLLVAVNPTRGLDLKATDYVRGKIIEACRAGAAVVLFTTDLDELFDLSTRSAFMSAGKLVSAERAASFVGDS